ncbi:N-acetyltransferase [Anaerobacillus alkaliphilus]|uniref:N-acetyltransferase n=1 Tax=Anaerobacillus alkaliphilus TaxID=1548597 RepID=A0A4Q0VM05_9BACI|nr:GNAT family N-acetyltransferase [Anaerobacillus alkaliphilus]RXI95547.1 N-acetyltransferase [Anaerobacillus alkaliphilus]
MNVMETKRLHIREFTRGDLPFLHAIFSDQETMQYYPAPFTIEKTQEWIARNQERYTRDGHGLWAICLKDTNELIGDCGLVKQVVEGRSEIEIGYHVHKNHWSHGYATEAAIACKEFGFTHLKFKRLISIIDPSNEASIRVAKKVGLCKEKEAVIFNKLHMIYSVSQI